MMKQIIGLLLFGIFSLSTQAQERIVEVKPFNKVIVSPIIDVELIKGDHESVRIVAEGVDFDKINVRNSGKTLKLFLDHARMGKKHEKVYREDEPDVLFYRSRYEGAKVKAYVTFKSLERVQVRGDGKLICNDRLGSEKLKLKLYGEIDAEIASIDTKKLKVAAFGDNEIKIRGGAANRQVYKMFGDNQIYTTKVNSTNARVSVFGEGAVRLSADQKIKLSSFGDSRIFYSGDPVISKSIVLGDLRLRRN